MPRRTRHEEAGAVHHVFARSLEPLLFRTADDYRDYYERLAAVVVDHAWRCLAFCLMPNHVHLMVETPRPNLGVGMCRLQGDFAQQYNLRYGRRGYVWEGRYGSRRAKDDSQLWQTIGYIARNPTKAKLCADPADWPWSSCGAVLAERAPGWLDEARLLEYVGGIAGAADARRRYAEMCR